MPEWPVTKCRIFGVQTVSLNIHPRGLGYALVLLLNRELLPLVQSALAAIFVAGCGP